MAQFRPLHGSLAFVLGVAVIAIVIAALAALGGDETNPRHAAENTGAQEGRPPAAKVEPTPQPKGPAPLLPDLVPRVPDEIYISYSRGVRQLRFSTIAENHGDGPLTIQGEGVPVDGHYLAVQLIDMDDGSTVVRPAGKLVYSQEHGHWHYADFALFELFRYEEGAPPGEVYADRKITFCLMDQTLIEPRRPDLADEPRFVQCDWSFQGISAGWRDTYVASLPGQYIEIGDLPDGRYALRTTLDPENLVLESDMTNNVVTLIIDIQGDRVTRVDSF